MIFICLLNLSIYEVYGCFDGVYLVLCSWEFRFGVLLFLVVVVVYFVVECVGYLEGWVYGFVRYCVRLEYDIKKVLGYGGEGESEL